MIDWYYIQVLIIATAFCWGFSYCFKSDEVFGRAGDYMRNSWPKWATSPLFDCPFCMGSVYGTLFFIVFLWGYPWYMWPIFCFCITGMGHIFKE